MQTSLMLGAGLLWVQALAVMAAAAPAQDMLLWYPQPAAKWVESLPLGNGLINPFFPALRSGHRLFQRPSRQKQIPSSRQVSRRMVKPEQKAGRL